MRHPWGYGALLLACVAPLGVCARAEAAAGTALYAVAPGAEVRAEPSATAEVLGSLEPGEQVRLHAEQGVWRRVSAVRLTSPGWVPAWSLAPEKPDTTAEQSLVTATGDVNVRVGPSTSAELVAVLAEGCGLAALRCSDGWTQVRISGTKLTGWVPSWSVVPGTATRASAAVEIAPAPDRGETRYLSANSVYLREAPTIEADSLALLGKDTVVYPIDQAGEWVRVRVHEGPEGWICRAYIANTPNVSGGGPMIVGAPPETRQSVVSKLDVLQDNQGIVYQDQVSVRSGPSADFPAHATMPAGVVFEILAQQNGWFKARFPDGTEGWVASWLCIANQMPELQDPTFTVLEPNPAPQPTGPRATEIGNYIARLAYSQIGKPYVWGAESPSVGFDCSGLLQWTHAQAGIRLPRTSFDQVKVGRWVTLDQLIPGDCVFFANTYTPGVSHCGIYAGGGYFIHAPGSGKRVRMEPLANRFSHYYGARRMY